MKNKVKKYLKNLYKAKRIEEIRQLANHPDLTEDEKWLIIYTFAEDRMVINTARKLNMSERKFYNTQDVVLTKLYYIIFR
jgi:hypothetical protein|nr:MAG TPA: hypothetical protein [Caudoviricetes sp.]